MAEPMAVWAEAWVMAADAEGIKLPLGAQRLITGSPVTSDSDPWDEAKALVTRAGMPAEALVYLHGTSNRPDGGKWIVTHLAVVELGAISTDDWPAALNTDKLLDYFGRPYPHGATEAPVPRDADVINHAIGHAADQLAKNSEFIAALDGTPSGEDWRRELGRRTPTLAMMYRTDWDTLGHRGGVMGETMQPYPPTTADVLAGMIATYLRAGSDGDIIGLAYDLEDKLGVEASDALWREASALVFAAADPLFDTPQVTTDAEGRHWCQGREYAAVDVDGELDYQPKEKA